MKTKVIVLSVNIVMPVLVWFYLANLMNNMGVALDNYLPVDEVYGGEIMVKVIWLFMIALPILIIVDVFCTYKSIKSKK